MKTNTKSSRPSHRFGISLNGFPYGLITAQTRNQAVRYFHTLTKNIHNTKSNKINAFKVA